MTRSQAILAALRREVERHQALIDGAADLHTLQVTLKFVVGTEQIRGVVWQEERLSAPAKIAPAPAEARLTARDRV